MATSAGEVEVKLSVDGDDFKNGLSAATGELNNFGNVMDEFGKRLLTVFSFAAIADFFKQSLSAYADNELAVTKLVAALNNQGMATQENVSHLENLATALSETTGASRDTILSAQAMLATFGLTVDQMDKVTQAALDLSAATGVDLERAALLLGKAFDGQTQALSRYGIVVNSHIDLNRRFSAVMDQVNQRFGGAAAAQANTYTGSIAKMKVAFTELEEEIGKFLSGPAGGLVKWITETITGWAEFMGKVNTANSIFSGLALIIGTILINVFRNFGNIVLTVLATLTRLLSTIPLIGNAFKSTAQTVQLMQMEFNALIQAEKNELAQSLTSETKKQAAVMQTKEIVIQAVDVASKETQDKMLEDQKLREKLLADAKKAHEDFVMSFMTTEADMWKFAQSTSDSFFQGFGDGFAKMIVEGKDFGESMKEVFKNMAEQIISYIMQMIAKLLVLFALEQATGIGGGVAAGSMIGSGFSGFMAEGGMINEPSVITGLRSGSRILAGENGPEMVVPTGGGGNMTADQMGGLPGVGGQQQGGNVTINIQGQFLEADSATWNRLMREQIIPQIRRFTMASPTGPFNRTRGVV